MTLKHRISAICASSVLLLIGGCISTPFETKTAPGVETQKPVASKPPANQTEIKTAPGAGTQESDALNPQAKWVFDIKSIDALDDSDSLGVSIRDLNKKPSNEAQSYLEDKTFLFFSESHGTQVEYLHPAGDSHLWYPGNRGTVYGNWIFKQKDGRYNICFKYGKRTFNPVTRSRGGKWRCKDIADFSSQLTEIRSGDVFDLSSSKVPHRLSPNGTTLDALLSGETGTRAPKSLTHRHTQGIYLRKQREALRLIKSEESAQDVERAVSLFKEAADGGIAPAQYWLGKIYNTGLYINGAQVTQNKVEAVKWLDLAAYHARSRNRKLSVAKKRDDITDQLTPHQILEAKNRSQAWIQKHQPY